MLDNLPVFRDLLQGWKGPTSRRHRPQYRLLVLVLLLVLIGVVVQFVISPALSVSAGLDAQDNYFFNRHLIAVGTGLLALLVGFKVKITNLVKAGPWMVLIGLALALLTIILANSSSRWLQIGPVSFQTVELLKIGFILTAAAYLSQVRGKDGSVRGSQGVSLSLNALRPLLLIIGLMTIIVAVIQSDLGSLFVILAVFMMMLWLSDFPIKHFILFTVLAGFLVTMLVTTTPYRRERVATLINPTADCRDSGYQACQALIGIGSGGLFGRGIGQSVQVYGYLPEAKNDSVFAIYAEVVGFIGSLVLLLLFYGLFRTIYRVCLKSEYLMMLICAGVLTWLSVQTAVNIGAMLGLIPLKGITLPYLSYGGSSLLLVMFATGIVLQISAYTNYGGAATRPPVNPKTVRRRQDPQKDRSIPAGSS